MYLQRWHHNDEVLHMHCFSFLMQTVYVALQDGDVKMADATTAKTEKERNSSKLLVKLLTSDLHQMKRVSSRDSAMLSLPLGQQLTSLAAFATSLTLRAMCAAIDMVFLVHAYANAWFFVVPLHGLGSLFV
ncbi:uncharacterized protein LOC131248598 isoform X3 [Magnolia sinica]|uniref:uncharacterized protein LOC131248598 isoform X3 n=1 Tax=Magnolia sinica TaxID=86752 RepID=UPI0026587197|nr:uncharacterized protein LOC131248598 isoform X3 [Magnolia sinica]